MKNKADNKKRNFLTHSEIESLLKAANTGPHAARNYCLTLLCFIHGFRASEICRLRISDIDLKAKCIYIHRLKKGFSTTHPLLNKEVQALKNWLSIRTSYPHAESEWVFLSRKGNPLSRQQFYHIISTSGGNAGLSLEIHPHMLRHSCGFALANMGIDTRDLSRIILGIAIFVILSGIPPAMQGVFTASGIEPEDDSVTLFYRDS